MIFFIDLENFIIPDVLNFSIMFLAFMKNFLPNLNTSFVQDIDKSIIGGIVGYMYLVNYFFIQNYKKD
jgi:hypothetical protein